MRVGYDGQVLQGHLTGFGRAFERLIQRLRKEFPSHEYMPIVPADRSAWTLVHQLYWDQVAFPRRARSAHADLLHATGHSAPIGTRRKVVMTIHDLAPTRLPHLLPHWRSRWYWGTWIPTTARFADAVHVPSHSTKADLVSIFNVPESRVHVVPWGVEAEKASEEVIIEIRRRYHLDGPYVLYVGTIDRRKDYQTLLSAMSALDPTVDLVVAGTVIKGRTDFFESIDRLALHPRVHVLGYVPDRDLGGLYGGASVFVYPSFYEGFGLPVLEAMASGVPVITYHAASLPEVAGHAAILLTPPVDAEVLAAAIRRILHDRSHAEEMRSRGYEHVRTFDWTATARRMMAVYAGLV